MPLAEARQKRKLNTIKDPISGQERDLQQNEPEYREPITPQMIVPPPAASLTQFQNPQAPAPSPLAMGTQAVPKPVIDPGTVGKLPYGTFDDDPKYSEPNRETPSHELPKEIAPVGAKDYISQAESNLLDLNRRVAGNPADIANEQAAMHQPVGFGRKLGGVLAGIGGAALGADPFKIYDSVSQAKNREAARPFAERRSITEAQTALEQKVEPLTTAHMNAEAQLQNAAGGKDFHITYVGKDGKQHVGLVSQSGETQDLTFGDARPLAFRVFGAGITGNEVKARSARGEVFMSPEGTPIDTSQLTDYDELRTTSVPGTYVQVSQPSVTRTFDNTVTQQPRLDASASKPLGQARVGTDTTRESVLGETPEGAPIVGPLRTESQPTASRFSTRAPVAPAPEPTMPEAPAGTFAPVSTAAPAPKVSLPPAPGGAVAPTKPAQAAPAKSPMQTRVLAGVYGKGTAKEFRDKSAPIRTGMTSLINDPEHKTPDSLMDFDYLADDAGARERLGNFNTLFLDSLNASNGAQGELGASVSGVHVGTGQFGAWVSNKLGLPSLAAGAQAQTLESAYGKLQPAEQRYVNALVDAMETTPGFRKVTGGGVYEYAVTQMQRTLPIFGKTGVSSSKMYNDKIMRMVQQNLVGTEQISEDFLPKKYYQQKLDELARKVGVSGPGGGGPGPGGPGQGTQPSFSPNNPFANKR